MNKPEPYIVKRDILYMECRCPAKINLFLHITGKRADGYHNIVSLMCLVALYDRISLTFNTNEIKVFCNHDNVPEDETNLAFKAADIFFKKTGIAKGVHIDIEKNIPVAGGVGGGSSNAASVLMALNSHYGHKFSRKELMDIGFLLGADIPFFIFQKPAVATGIGEKLQAYEGLTNFYVILISFNFNVSTANVYKNFNLGLTKCKKINKSLPLKKQDFDVEYLYNDLEAVTASNYPDIITAKKALLDQGARGVLMSGSGPTVFGLFSDLSRAEKARLYLSKIWKLYLTDMIV